MAARVALSVFLLALVSSAAATPTIHHWTLPNGARVYFAQTRELPLVQARIVFDAGSSRDPRGKNGLAALTNAMLSEGAGELDADEIATRFDAVGAEFSAGIDRDMGGVTLRALSYPTILEPALDTLALILRRPNFPQKNLDREREHAQVKLLSEAQSPAVLASKSFYAALYGDHPYSNHPVGDVQGLKAITREDVVNFYRRYYVGANAVMALVGDLSKRQARALSDRMLGGLPAGKPAPAIAPVPEPGGAREKRVEFPSTQSHVRMGLPVLRRLDPDYFTLYVGNYILGGGGLVSRLSNVIREQHGLSYSVYSYFYPMRRKGPFILGLQTENSQLGKALGLMRETVKDFIEKGPQAKELDAAKKHLTGGFPLRIDSNSKIADYLAVIGFYELPLTYLDDFIPRVEAVTLEQVRAAFRRRVQPAKMVTVIVGGGHE